MVFNVRHFPGRELVLNGETFLYFGGTAYLGLQTDPEFQNSYIENVKKFGTNYGASRKGNIRLSVYRECEAHLASLIGSEDCLTMSSGYLAGQLVSKHFHQKGHPCFFAPGTHKAVRFSTFEKYKNRDTLINAIETTIKKKEMDPVLFLESVHLDGKNYPRFEWLQRLPLNDLILVVDDSHGLGIIGDEGGGVFRSLKKLGPKKLVVCGSLGKGFGIPAGVIAGTAKSIEPMRASEMFAAASPASPASLSTLIDSTGLLSKKRKLLQGHIGYFRSKIDKADRFDFIPEYPSFGFDDAGLTAHLFDDKIIVTNFNYPSESDPMVRRIVLSAHHTHKDIDLLANSVNAYVD